MSQFIRLTDLPFSPDLGWRLGEIYLPMASIVAGLRGPQGPQGDPADPAVLDDLQTQIDAIYNTEITPSLKNATYANGILHWTGGKITLPFGDVSAAVATVPSSTPLSITLPVGTLSSGQFLLALWHSSADPAVALPQSQGAQQGLSVLVDFNGSYVRADSNSFGSLADFDPNQIVLEDKHLKISVPDYPNATYTTPDTVYDTPLYLHVYAISENQSPVPDVSFEFVGAAATGLLPDETAARIAGDDALQQQIDDVQTLAEVNQLNITTKADQADLDSLQTTVTGQGLTLLQKADQTALDALGTVVSGKATPADITAAIAALVDGAPDALNTLSEIATALAGEQAQIADLLTALALRVRVDAIQSLTTAQQLQARQNINAEAVGVAAGLVAAITPASIGAATSVQGGKADTALQSGDVAPVALSGQYSDLAGLPTIPGLSSSTPAAPTSGGTAGTATTAARGDHVHPLPTAAQITAAVLTGLATGSATAIAAADTILQALAKLQAQASQNASGVASNAALLVPVPKKLGATWYTSGRWYDLGYPYGFSITTQSVAGGAVRYFAYIPLETVTLQNIATNIAGAMTAGGTMKFGIYADTNGFPAARIYASSAIAGDTTGVKTAACTQTLTAGTVYWFGIFVSATAVFSANMVARTYGGGAAFGIGGLTHTGLSDITSSGAGAGFTGAGYAPFLSFQVQ